MAAVLKRLPRIKGMTQDERVLWARFLAATPDERWHLHLAALRSVSSFMRSAKKRSLSYWGGRNESGGGQLPTPLIGHHSLPQIIDLVGQVLRK